jgi:hypothetical protein
MAALRLSQNQLSSEEIRIKFSQNSDQVQIVATEILLKLLTNLVQNPNIQKYRSISVSNKRLQTDLWPASGSRDLLIMIGFVSTSLDGITKLELFGEVDVSRVTDTIEWLEAGLATVKSTMAASRSSAPAAGISSQERQRRFDEGKKRAKANEEARQRALLEFHGDKEHRLAKQRPSAASPIIRSQAPTSARTSSAPLPPPPPAAAAAIVVERNCRMRVRLPDGGVWQHTFSASTLLSDVYQILLTDQRLSSVLGALHNDGDDSSPGFSLMITQPHRELFLEMFGNSTLSQLGLCPAVSLVAFPSAARGVVRSGQLENALRATDGDGMDENALDEMTYEDLLELEAHIGHATSHAGGSNRRRDPSREQGASSSSSCCCDNSSRKNEGRVGTERTLVQEDIDDPMFERRCAIDLEPWCVGDRAWFLDCGHAFHPRCIQNWLRESPLCPMCKAPVRLERSGVQGA